MSKENTTAYAILGLLTHDDLSGYDIKKKIDMSLNYFWNAGFGQIYPTLKFLEKGGLIKKTQEEEKKTSRLVYGITPAGRKELKNWLSSPIDKEYVKYDILLKLFFGSQLSTLENINKIKEFKEKALTNLQDMAGYKHNLEAVLSENKDHLYYYLTVLFGEKIYQAYVDWSDEAIKILKHTNDIE